MPFSFAKPMVSRSICGRSVPSVSSGSEVKNLTVRSGFKFSRDCLITFGSNLRECFLEGAVQNRGELISLVNDISYVVWESRIIHPVKDYIDNKLLADLIFPSRLCPNETGE